MPTASFPGFSSVVSISQFSQQELESSQCLLEFRLVLQLTQDQRSVVSGQSLGPKGVLKLPSLPTWGHPESRLTPEGWKAMWNKGETIPAKAT